MSTILWLGEKLLNVALIMVIVVFQPELRKSVGRSGKAAAVFVPYKSWNGARHYKAL